MAIGLKSNLDGSGGLLNNGVNLLTLGNDNSVKGLFKDTDGSRIVGVPRHNYIVDGAFDFFYEGNTQTTAGYTDNISTSGFRRYVTATATGGLYLTNRIVVDARL